MRPTAGNSVDTKPFWPRLVAGLQRRWAGTITGVSDSGAKVALTFDDGPDPEFTPRLLDVLRTHKARGTFFLVGEAASRHPDLIQRIAAEGHAVGNHSWDHESLVGLSFLDCLRQIHACRKIIKPFDSRLFRPPYGHLDWRTRLAPLMLGYQVIAWDATGVDWSGEGADDIVENLKPQWHNGAIVLLHDNLYRSTNQNFRNRDATIEAVKRLLLNHPETEFVTVPELLQSGQAVKRNWTMVPTQDWNPEEGVA